MTMQTSRHLLLRSELLWWSSLRRRRPEQVTKIGELSCREPNKKEAHCPQCHCLGKSRWNQSKCYCPKQHQQFQYKIKQATSSDHGDTKADKREKQHHFVSLLLPCVYCVHNVCFSTLCSSVHFCVVWCGVTLMNRVRAFDHISRTIFLLEMQCIGQDDIFDNQAQITTRRDPAAVHLIWSKNTVTS